VGLHFGRTFWAHILGAHFGRFYLQTHLVTLVRIGFLEIVHTDVHEIKDVNTANETSRTLKATEPDLKTTELEHLRLQNQNLKLHNQNT
jgi:hypothetical protein